MQRRGPAYHFVRLATAGGEKRRVALRTRPVSVMTPVTLFEASGQLAQLLARPVWFW